MGVDVADAFHSVSRSLLIEIRALLLACIRALLWRCIGVEVADVCHSAPSVKRDLMQARQRDLISIKRDLLTRAYLRTPRAATPQRVSRSLLIEIRTLLLA